MQRDRLGVTRRKRSRALITMSAHPPGILIPWTRGNDSAPLRDREWLVTNGLGGFASGTLLGIPTRRYHGVFVPNLAQPKGRYIMLSRLDEQIFDGRNSVQLGGAESAVHGLQTQAHQYLKSFTLQYQMPTWSFEIDDHLLEKTIVMPQHQNLVCIQYRLLGGNTMRMRLRLYASFRRQDAPLNHDPHWPFTLSVSGGRHELYMADSPLRLRFGVLPHVAPFVADEQHDADVLYRVER